ncbi:hypothetical protein Trydic_g1877 [Trypoxylus dichotomus]
MEDFNGRIEKKVGHKIVGQHSEDVIDDSGMRLIEKRAVIKTLVDRAAQICERQHIEQELQHLNQALQANGYGNPQITNRQRTPTIQRLAGDSVPTLYQERYGPNRQDIKATQYKNDIQTYALTPPATFGEGSQGSPNIERSIQDSLFL